ncbi:MAG: hypothetical protein J6W65_01830, partial [Oscillospiraceae bacterium]|nr:hypothetical protein [Oscillospiraceae bacterium]
ALAGIIGLLLIGFSPVVVKIRSIFGLLELEEDKRTKVFRKKHRRELASYSMIAFLAGLAIGFIGWCWGYAQKGEDFWFYRKYKQHYISEETPGEWDKISEDGKYIDNNGNKYTYYILVRGNEIRFCKDECRNTDDLRDKLDLVPRENTVIIADSYAVASKYEAVKALLKEMGFKYETEEV